MKKKIKLEDSNEHLENRPCEAQKILLKPCPCQLWVGQTDVSFILGHQGVAKSVKRGLVGGCGGTHI